MQRLQAWTCGRRRRESGEEGGEKGERGKMPPSTTPRRLGSRPRQASAIVSVSV